MAIIAASFAGAYILLFFPCFEKCLWGDTGEKYLAFVGAAALLLGLGSLFCIEGTKHRPLGVGLAAIAVLVGGFGFLFIPATCRVRENAKRASCKNNLRQVAIALHLYADDYDGAFPEGFLQLYQGNYTDNASKIFSCPSEPSSWKDFQPGGKVTEKSTSYAYVAGLSSSMPRDLIIAFDKSPMNHKKEGQGGGRNVLRIDCSVEWWPAAREAELQKTLADQASRLPELRREWERLRAAKKYLGTGADGRPLPIPPGLLPDSEKP